MSTIDEQIAAAVAAVDYGTPSASKRGRNPKWPYVPVIETWENNLLIKTRQIPRYAFATRPEAVDFAAQTIANARTALARKLGQRQYRALREAHGLPRELPKDTTP